MPIRINLLAEAQAIEELRRRDPVKRAIWVGVALVVLMLAWSSELQLKSLIARGELNRVAAQLNNRTNDFQQVMTNQRKLAESNRKLALIQQMSTNRMLHGTLLSALQQTTLDDVQLMRLKTDETYIYNEEIKTKTNAANDHIIPGRPASVTEKITVTLEARDSAPNPGDQVNRFKQAINHSSYFQTMLGSNEVRLTNLSPPQTLDGKPYVLFTLECRYPEKTR